MAPSALGRGCRRPGFTLIVGRVTRQNQGQPTLLRQSGRPDLNRGPLVPQTSALTRLRHAPSTVDGIATRGDRPMPGMSAWASEAPSQAMPQQAAPGSGQTRAISLGACTAG